MNDGTQDLSDFKLFLALHCDMDYPNDGGSGFADFPEPQTDGATAESQRICKIINETYFPEVKINLLISKMYYNFVAYNLNTQQNESRF